MTLMEERTESLARATKRGGRRSAPLRTEYESVGCPQCGAVEFDSCFDPTHTSARDINFTDHDRPPFAVVRCRRCGLAYTNPRPAEASIARFYPPGYGPHEDATRDDGWRGQVRRTVERAVLRARFGHPPRTYGRGARLGVALAAMLGTVIFRTRRERLGWIEFRGRVELLDFGCGGGKFLRRMREFGWSVTGIDAAATVAERVENETGIRVLAGSLPHEEVRPASFDVITMWNSLEHVHRPREVLRAARIALVPGGRLVVAVPNFDSWSARTFGPAWFGLDLPRHLTHFTLKTLSAMLETEGFQVLELQHVGRDGWLRHSARTAAAAGIATGWRRLCAWKPLARRIANWTERAEQADMIRVVAEATRNHE